MAKAKPEQAEQVAAEDVTKDTPEVTQPATPEADTPEQPTATPEVPAAQETQDVAEAPVVYKRADGVRVTELPGGTIREDY